MKFRDYQIDIIEKGTKIIITEAQAKQLEEGIIQKKIEKGYKDICTQICYEKIEAIFLRHK